MGTGTREALNVAALNTASAELARVADRSSAVAARLRAPCEEMTAHVRELWRMIEQLQAAVHAARTDAEAVRQGDEARAALLELIAAEKLPRRGPMPPAILAARATVQEAERALQDAPGLGDADRTRVAAAADHGLAAVELLRRSVVTPLNEARTRLNDIERVLGALDTGGAP